MSVAELVIFSPRSFALRYVIIVKQEFKYAWPGDLESLNSFPATLLPPVSCYCGWRQASQKFWQDDNCVDSTYGPWVYRIQLHFSLFTVVIVGFLGLETNAFLASSDNFFLSQGFNIFAQTTSSCVWRAWKAFFLKMWLYAISDLVVQLKKDMNSSI